MTVDDETQVIEDGKAYHEYLDPEMAAAQGPSGDPQEQEARRDRAEKVDRR